MNFGEWLTTEQQYGLFCSECGQEDIWHQYLQRSRSSENASVTAMAGGMPRLGCLSCKAINKTTNSSTLARMIRKFVAQEAEAALPMARPGPRKRVRR